MRRPRFKLAAVIIALAASLAGCKQDPTTNPTAAPQGPEAAAALAPGASPTPTPTPAARPSGPVEFTDVTAEAGIRFRHNNGAAGKKYLPETMGAGAAFFDSDNDGWLDILFVNSTSWPENRGPATTSALYRNQGDGTFRDVTREAGLA